MRVTLRAALLRLALFSAAALAVLVTIAGTISPLGSSAGRTTYHAIFRSASTLVAGDDVRVAGVKVGSVADVHVTPDGQAAVAFAVDADLPVTESTTAEIRYLDLAGHRYLGLEPGRRDAPAQAPDDPLGVDRTAPALDINDLLNGFKPLLVGLSPAAVNDLSLAIISTLQGDGSAVGDLVRRTASLTQGIADRDAMIGSVVQNLNATMGTLAGHHAELEALIRQLGAFASGLARDRATVGQAIAHIDEMTALSTGLIARSRPALAADIRHLAGVAGTLASPLGRARIDHALDHLPHKLARLAATAGYGSWFNYYVCGVRVFVDATAQRIDPGLSRALEQIHLTDDSARCRA
jgi:phospholipid/cholesterol/gamma-HCH transport system substrate-binding protein